MIFNLDKSIKKILTKEFVQKIFVFVFTQIIFLVTIIHFIYQNPTVQSWDARVQHSNFVSLKDQIKNIPNNKIKNLKNILLKSIETEDYNDLSVAPLVIITNIFQGYSRERFIFYTYLIYIVPCFYLFYKTSKLINHNQSTLFGFFICNLIFFFNPFTIINLINGQTTIDGVILILLTINQPTT